MNVALVYDRVNKWGGAERVLLALHELWPRAPLFTAVYDPARAGWANVFTIHTSYLQNLPFAKRTHESLAMLTPMAFETFSFDAYDVVISVTSAEAKNIVTKPTTLHICYCLTPTRYLWSGYDQYQTQPGLGMFSNLASVGLRLFGPTLRKWDIVASSRPDYYVAISHRVSSRIRQYYHRNAAAVIYPPVDTKKFNIRNIGDKANGQYFLTVSRLVSYKRIDVIIRAFNRLGLPLIIIGNGRQKAELKKMAGSTISFIDRHLTDSELVSYYEGCRAFVFAADEDFGIAAAEAQASGKPVIAYKSSGIAEIVKEGKTGILFDQQTPESMMRAVHTFERLRFDSESCRKQAEQMSTDTFKKNMRDLVSRLKP